MKRVMRDRITFTRNTVSQNEFGDNVVDSTATLGTFFCHLRHKSGFINQTDELERQIEVDYELFFRKKSVSSIQKGDIGTLETPNIQVKINEIVEHDLQTIKMLATSVS